MTEAFLPIGLRMEGRPVTIVGAGAVAARKAAKLANAGAALTVVAPEFFPSLKYWESLDATLVPGVYRGLGDMARPFLVVAATNDSSVNALVARDARALGALVARVDAPDDSDLTFPATLRRGRLTVSFATDGTAPSVASLLRQNAETQFDEGYAVLTEVVSRVQGLARFKTLSAETQQDFFTWERITAIRSMIGHLGEHATFEALLGELEAIAEASPQNVARISSMPARNSRHPSEPGVVTAKVRDSEPLTTRGVVGLPDARGLLIVHTGDGKGKTSAALNLVYRHLAHGKAVSVIQFVKNPREFEYGDVVMLERLRAQGCPVTVTMMGAGYTWRTGDTEECRELAARGWEQAAAAIMNPKIELVICDELHIALRHGHLDLRPVLRTIVARPLSSHVVTTGRNAPEELLAMADLVTDFVAVKHPYHAGVRAQAGIEY